MDLDSTIIEDQEVDKTILKNENFTETFHSHKVKVPLVNFLKNFCPEFSKKWK